MPVHKKYNRNVKTNALGRGLDALISTESVSTQGSSTINEVPLQQIEANPNQPRREFDPVALEELASSIRQLGIVQPITLRQVDHDRFQIIAGERRWRASQLAGLTTIPAYIRTIKDENVMEMALVENIQREDLNAIEIALAYEHLLEKSAMTQEKVAERVGKSRPAIANYLRLLKLPAQVQMALQKEGDRHGPRPRPPLFGQSVAPAEGVSRDPEERLHRAPRRRGVQTAEERRGRAVGEEDYRCHAPSAGGV